VTIFDKSGAKYTYTINTLYVNSPIANTAFQFNKAKYPGGAGITENQAGIDGRREVRLAERRRKKLKVSLYSRLITSYKLLNMIDRKVLKL
jgi:hypothetical protein